MFNLIDCDSTHAPVHDTYTHARAPSHSICICLYSSSLLALRPVLPVSVNRSITLVSWIERFASRSLSSNLLGDKLKRYYRRRVDFRSALAYGSIRFCLTDSSKRRKKIDTRGNCLDYNVAFVDFLSFSLSRVYVCGVFVFVFVFKGENREKAPFVGWLK